MRNKLLVVAAAGLAVAALGAPAQDMVPTPGSDAPAFRNAGSHAGLDSAAHRRGRPTRPRRMKKGLPKTPNSMDPESRRLRRSGDGRTPAPGAA